MAISKLILNGVTQMDVTSNTATDDTTLSNYTGTGADGETFTGNIATKTSSNLTVSGATVTAPAGYYASAASKTVASGSATTPATTISVTPGISVSSGGLITATASGTKSVTPTVSAGYVSSGTAGTITVSGSNTSQLSTQGATTITPSTSQQTAVAANKYTTGAVMVAAMPSGTAGTPSATKGTVSNHSISITPSVTNVTGYITGGTKTGTAVSVSASELVSGNLPITQNGNNIDVTNYASASVNVPNDPDIPIFTITWYDDWSDIATITCDKTYAQCQTYMDAGIGTVIINETDQSQTEAFIRAAEILTVRDTSITYYAGGKDPYIDITISSDGITWNYPSNIPQILNVTSNGTYYPGIVHTISQVNVNVQSGEGTTAVASDIRKGKTALVASGLVTGTAELIYNSTTEELHVPDWMVDIMSGGNEPDDVTFYDYDGSVWASYSASDFADLSTLPPNPSHSGLTAQGWNWSLSDAKTHVATYGKLNIGQMYITDDGKTRLYIEIPEGAAGDQLTFYVRYKQSVANGVTVDWGDGSTPETYSETTYAVNGSHTYTYPGKYIITLKVTSGTLLFDEGTTSNAIYGSTSIYYNRMRIYKAEIGLSVSSIGYHAFGNCHAMKAISLPSGITSIDTQAFNSCYILNFISIPSGVTSTGNYGFQYCYALKAIALPKSVSSIGTYSFRYCYSLKSIALNVSSINNYALQYCCNIASIIIPQSVTSIGNSALTQCYGMAYIKMLPTAPPTLGTSNFTNMTKCIIYVPYSADHSVLAAYKTATNWSAFASQMVEMPAP